MATVQGADQHHEIIDVTTSTRPRVLMVVANPTTSTTTGWTRSPTRVTSRSGRPTI
jgi:hypothetical protein